MVQRDEAATNDYTRVLSAQKPRDFLSLREAFDVTKRYDWFNSHTLTPESVPGSHTSTRTTCISPQTARDSVQLSAVEHLLV